MTSTPKPADDDSAENFVNTWDELATRLGVNRRSIQDWRRDPRYKPQIDRRWKSLERADGRKCVPEWRRLMADLNLKRGKAAAEIAEEEAAAAAQDGVFIQPPRYGGTAYDWSKAKIAKEVERKDIEIQSLQGTLLEAPELEVPLGTMFAAIQNKSTQFPTRVARYLVGLRDIGEIEDKLRDEMDADLADLRAAHFITRDSVEQIVASLPFDEESEHLFTLVTFDGQDRETLLRLVAHVATEALRHVGRRAIAEAQRQTTVPDTALADDVTGQVTPEASDREARHRSASPAADSHPEAVPTVEASTRRQNPKHPRSPSARSVQPPDTAGKARGAGKRKSRARPKPATGTGEIEALVTPEPSKSTRKRRR